MVKKRKTRKRKKISNPKKCLFITLGVVGLAVICLTIWLWIAAYSKFDSENSVTVYIPANSTEQAINDSLKTRLGAYGVTVARLWGIRGGSPEKATGVYTIAPGDRAWSVAGRLKSGRSSTVRVTYNNIRLMSDLADRVSSYFPWDSSAFLVACDSVLPHYGFKKEEYPAAFLPDTYEYYASETPERLVTSLVEHRNRFWSLQRRDKAKKLGLTPVQVATLASIVEEESSNRTEHPAIARLYLNRLKKGMRLQADPTVKFAAGNFALKRVYGKHTETESPYNTYRVYGLPPGPIRIADKKSLDEVLDAPENDYLYMCAKPGGKQEHNFTSDYAKHLANARAYQQWLDSMNIK